MAKKNIKTFVLDTNVLLHDFNSIFQFEENNIVVPIVVLEELDRFKKGSDIINFHAREFVRVLDQLSGNILDAKGISLGEGKGVLKIETAKPFSPELRDSFPELSADHRILAISDWLRKNHSEQVILVTKDINLRMKAKSIGITAMDYENDKVANIDILNKGVSQIDGVDNLLITRLYDEHDGISIKDFTLPETPIANQYYIMKGSKSSALTHFDSRNQVFRRVEKFKTYGIEPRNAEQTFSIHALTDPNIQLVALTGKAGTGKTLIALATAIYQRKQFNQILLARPIVPLSNRDLGFLPGDVKEKIGPYMQPLFDNLGVIKHSFKQTSPEYSKIEELQKTEKLVITPLAYIRGRSLSKVFFIVDEAQNLTPHEVKTIITRAGEGTKIVFTGDIQQIDSPYLDTESNGLSYLTDRMRGQDIFAHVNLIKGERSYLAELASDLL